MEKDREEWHGKWFPIKPGEVDPQLDEINNEIDSSSSSSSSSSFNRLKSMGIQDPNCDDAEVFKQNLLAHFQNNLISRLVSTILA